MVDAIDQAVHQFKTPRPRGCGLPQNQCKLAPSFIFWWGEKQEAMIIRDHIYFSL
jgi:hypothetical protein